MGCMTARLRINLPTTSCNPSTPVGSTLPESVRQYQDSRGDRFFEVITDPEQLVSDEWGGAIACSPVLIGLYGRLACGKVVHIVDFNSLEAAHLMLNRMGLMAMDAGRRTTASATTDSTL